MKTVTLYRPSAIQNYLSDFDRCIGSFFGDSLTPITRTSGHLPAVDIRETSNTYTLDMELPGFDEKNIEIHLDGGHLTVSSKQEETKEEKKNETADGITWIHRERRLDSFSRSFKLPENANPEEVSASFKNGVLSMEIKKRAEAQKRLIPINAM